MLRPQLSLTSLEDRFTPASTVHLTPIGGGNVVNVGVVLPEPPPTPVTPIVVTPPPVVPPSDPTV